MMGKLIRGITYMRTRYTAWPKTSVAVLFLKLNFFFQPANSFSPKTISINQMDRLAFVAVPLLINDLKGGSL